MSDPRDQIAQAKYLLTEARDMIERADAMIAEFTKPEYPPEPYTGSTYTVVGFEARYGTGLTATKQYVARKSANNGLWYVTGETQGRSWHALIDWIRSMSGHGDLTLLGSTRNISV